MKFSVWVRVESTYVINVEAKTVEEAEELVVHKMTVADIQKSGVPEESTVEFDMAEDEDGRQYWDEERDYWNDEDYPHES